MSIHKDSKGFTLLEILIVVVIIAALAALAIPAYTSTAEKARKQEAYSALAAVREAQQRYRAGHTAYATAFADLDFDPNDTMVGQTLRFAYTLGGADASAWTAQAERSPAAAGTAGEYTVVIDEAGTITSNF